MKQFDFDKANTFFLSLKNDHARRHYKREKEAFFEYIKANFPQREVRMDRIGSARNIVIGNLDTAEYIVTAHYDTARNAVLNCKLYYDKSRRKNAARMFLLILSAFLSVRTNTVSANDNTSGIVAVRDILSRCDNAAAILFDNEEGGYSGSMAFTKKRKNYRNKRMINLDCIGVGGSFAVIYNNGEEAFGKALYNCFDSAADVTCDRADASRYSSDGDDLKHAVTVAAFKRDKKGNRYIDDIHTKRDTQIDMNCVAAVCDAVVRLIGAQGQDAAIPE